MRWLARLAAACLALAATPASATECTYFAAVDAPSRGFAFFTNGIVRFREGARPVSLTARYEADSRIVVGRRAFALHGAGELLGEDGRLYRGRRGGPFGCRGRFDLAADLKARGPEAVACRRAAERKGDPATARDCCFTFLEPGSCRIFAARASSDGSQRPDVVRALGIACNAADQEACRTSRRLAP